MFEDIKYKDIPLYDVVFLLLVVGTILLVGHTEHIKGRIELCNELNKSYLVNHSCITPIKQYTTKLPNTIPREILLKWNITGEKNATIL